MNNGKLRLSGRRALITGAGGGIAHATALRFAADGAIVALTDIDIAAARKTADAVTAAGGRSEAIQADVTDRASVDALMKSAAVAMGGIDILVTCAGGYKA